MREDAVAELDALVVCGPSGVGKGTLLRRLLAEHGSRLGLSVSHTTRAPRPGERDGVDYHFVTAPVLRAMVEAGAFLEVCAVHGEHYGTSVAAVRAVRATGRVCVIEIDVKGAQKLCAGAAQGPTHPNRDPHTHNHNNDTNNDDNDDNTGQNGLQLRARYIFITAPLEELQRRLRERGTESEASLKRRLKTTIAELDFLDQNPNFFTAVVVNDDVERAYEHLVKTINAIFSQFHMPPLG